MSRYFVLCEQLFERNFLPCSLDNWQVVSKRKVPDGSSLSTQIRRQWSNYVSMQTSTALLRKFRPFCWTLSNCRAATTVYICFIDNIYLSIHPTTNPSIQPSFHPSSNPPILHPIILPPIHPTIIHPSNHPSTHPSTHLIHHSTHLSVSLPTKLFIYLSICLSVYMHTYIYIQQNSI